MVTNQRHERAHVLTIQRETQDVFHFVQAAAILRPKLVHGHDVTMSSRPKYSAQYGSCACNMKPFLCVSAQEWRNRTPNATN